jgi:hypothetical protein
MIFAEKIIAFLKELDFNGELPDGISIMNPFRENPEVVGIITKFYSRFYSDENQRHMILGINPGRFGAGVTGIPFTDTRRLTEKCGIPIKGVMTFEPSSSFVYDMIDAFGGTEKFYSDFYVTAISPLGFTSAGPKGRAVNYNFYDSKKLTEAVYDFMVESLKKQLNFGIYQDVCFCLGTGKNYRFLDELNSKFGFFKKIVALEHPRYIMQYKSKQKDYYISRYVDELGKVI